MVHRALRLPTSALLLLLLLLLLPPQLLLARLLGGWRAAADGADADAGALVGDGCGCRGGGGGGVVVIPAAAAAQRMLLLLHTHFLQPCRFGVVVSVDQEH